MLVVGRVSDNRGAAVAALHATSDSRAGRRLSRGAEPALRQNAYTIPVVDSLQRVTKQTRKMTVVEDVRW
jgi:hypothetical protein